MDQQLDISGPPPASDEEFERLLDAWYESREREHAEEEIARLEAQYKQMRKEVNEF